MFPRRRDSNNSSSNSKLKILRKKNSSTMSSSVEVTPIKAKKFYGNLIAVQKEIDRIERCNRRKRLHWTEEFVETMPQHIFSPTQDWSEFYKQADALQKCHQNSSLATFVCEKSNGHRKFIVAHPVVFWYYFSRAEPLDRCAYEVIPDEFPCSLYLDLEYPKDRNPDKNGPLMTQTLIEIICCYFNKYWRINCTEKNVLNLDSTNNVKFSRHLIFRIKDIVFKNNIHAGRFVKTICAEIEDYLITNCAAFHDILSYFDRTNLEELFIESPKKRKLFIDTGVYTRNRHFRIYQATKWGKRSYLTKALECKYVLQETDKDEELRFFMESLIAYYPQKKDLLLLEMKEDLSVDGHKYTQINHSPKINKQYCCTQSPYPNVDKFISDLVHPAAIRTLQYFEKSKTIVYDISGKGFCSNIGRPHKSNHIYWVADLKRKHAYQKCHDQEDCTDFKSEPKEFPVEICFQLEEDDDIFLNISDNFDTRPSLDSN